MKIIYNNYHGGYFLPIFEKFFFYCFYDWRKRGVETFYIFHLTINLLRKNNIEKDEIKKKINVKMNQIKKRDNSPWICDKDDEITHM
jgi:hypothetical protein